MNKYDRETDQFEKYVVSAILKNDKYSNIIFSVVPDKLNKSDNIWFSTRQGLFELNEKTKELKHYFISDERNDNAHRVHVIYQYDKKYLMLGCNNGDLYCFDINTKKIEKLIYRPPLEARRNSILSIVKDNKGFLWIGTVNGLYKYDFQNRKEIPVFVGDNYYEPLRWGFIKSIVYDNQNILWIGTAIHGVIKFNIKTYSHVQFLNNRNTPGSISWDNITCLLLDKGGIIWIGTNGYGIDK